MIVCEVMGRDAGWIAITSGIAGGADVIFVPEKPIDIDHAVKILKERHDRGKFFSIVVVAEGAKLPGTDKQATQGAKLDAFGHARLSGIGQTVAELIEEKTGYETRSVNLGHTNGEVRPLPTIACWRRVMVPLPSIWCTKGSLAGWWRCAAQRLPIFRWRMPSQKLAP